MVGRTVGTARYRACEYKCVLYFYWVWSLSKKKLCCYKMRFFKWIVMNMKKGLRFDVEIVIAYLFTKLELLITLGPGWARFVFGWTRTSRTRWWRGPRGWRTWRWWRKPRYPIPWTSWTCKSPQKEMKYLLV